MQKRNITSFVFLCLLSIHFFSCREKVDWDFPDFEPVPTINSILVAGEPIKVHVSLAGKFDSIPLSVVENAIIDLFADGEFIESLAYKEDGIFESSFNAESNILYKCEATIPGFPVATSICKIPLSQNILNIEHINFAGVDEEGVSYPAVKIEFSNSPGQPLYFEIVIRMLKYDWVTRPELINISDPVLLNEGLPLALFSNEMIDETSYTMTISYTTGSASYSSENGWQATLFPLTVELRTVNYDYYMYVKQLYLYETGRYPNIIGGVVTPFPLHSNVSNGFGIFAGYSSVKTDTIYPLGLK